MKTYLKITFFVSGKAWKEFTLTEENIINKTIPPDIEEFLSSSEFIVLNEQNKITQRHVIHAVNENGQTFSMSIYSDANNKTETTNTSENIPTDKPWEPGETVSLEKQLENAIRTENYELAAKLRDEINKK